VPKLVYLRSAKADLEDILARITRESGSLAVAKNYQAKIKAKMKTLSALPGPFGRPRPELEDGLRSTPLRSHITFSDTEPTHSKSSTSCTPAWTSTTISPTRTMTLS